MNEEVYWIWLQQGLGYFSLINNIIVSKEINPKEIFGKSYDEINSFGVFSPKDIFSLLETSIEKAQKIYNDCLKKGIKVYTPATKGYPERLKNIPSMPLVLYVKGDTNVFETIDIMPAITVVGARRFSPYGRKVSLTLSNDLASIGFVIVSGLAIGIDAFSHTGALKAGGKTIAVIGAGHDINYPKENAELRELIEENGCVVSEYAPNTPPHPHNFPMRNRIMTGISLGTLVVEAGERSGTLITAGHALTQGKDVFAVPNDIFDENGKGTLRLIKDGAKAVSCATDIIEEYFWMYHDKIKTNNIKSDYSIKGKKQKQNLECDLNLKSSNEHRNYKNTTEHSNIKSQPLKPKKKKTPLPFLTENQKLVYDVMTESPKTIDDIAKDTQLGMGELLSIITELEIYGLVVSHPGKQYSY